MHYGFWKYGDFKEGTRYYVCTLFQTMFVLIFHQNVMTSSDSNTTLYMADEFLSACIGDWRLNHSMLNLSNINPAKWCGHVTTMLRTTYLSHDYMTCCNTMNDYPFIVLDK